MKILVIIVNYKDELNLRACLTSLDPDLDICVVDNSGQRTRKLEVDEFKNVKVISTGKNVGFAAGVNVVLRFARGKLKYDWVWLLNPDCIVNGGLKEFMENYADKYDIFAPVIYDTKGKIWFAGGKINRWTGECCHKINEVDWVSGCSMFISKKVFDAIGFFDEKFFLFYEDVDFCLRAKASGFRVGVIGKDNLEDEEELERLKVIHNVSQSVKNLKDKYAIEMKSKFYLLKKHGEYFYPTAGLISWMRMVKHRMSSRR